MKRTAVVLGATVLLYLTPASASQPPTVHRPAHIASVDATLIAADLDGRLSPPAPEATAYGLTVERTVQLALERNLDLLIAAYEPAIADANIMMEEGRFDPVMSLQMTSTGISGSTMNNQNLGITHRTGAGTVYGIQYRNNLNQGLDQSFQPFFGGSPNAVINIVHPLMRGAGSQVVRARLNIAKAQREAALAGYQLKALDVAAAAEQSYWTLVLARRRLDMERVAMQHTQALEDIVSQNIKLGRLAEYEVYSTRQRLASQQADIRRTERDSRQAEQQMQRVLRLAIANTPLKPEQDLVYDADRARLVSTDPLPSLVDDAVKRRPEVRMAELEVANLQIQEVADRNATKPLLNLVGEYRLGNTSTGVTVDSNGNSYNSTLYRYRVGVEFGVTFGNHEALGQLKRTQMRLAQARIRLEDVKQAVALEVSQAWASVDSAQQNVESARQATGAAEQNLSAEQERFQAGLTSVAVVLEAQQLVNAAQDRALAALGDYYNAQVVLHRASGMTLQRYSIALSPPDTGKPPSTDLALPPDT